MYPCTPKRYAVIVNSTTAARHVLFDSVDYDYSFEQPGTQVVGMAIESTHLSDLYITHTHTYDDSGSE